MKLRLWEDLRTDLRYAIRMLFKSPGFAAIAIGSLAMGIGANTAIFTIAKQILFDRLAVPHPEQLELFTWAAPKSSIVAHMWSDAGPDGQRTSFPYPVYQQLRSSNHVLGDLFAFKNLGRLSASIEGKAVAVQGQMVSGNYYATLEIHPILGRPIEPSDDATPSNGSVAVISDQVWTRYFASSQSVIGKAILLNGKPFTIIGVNPPQFTGASDVHLAPDIFVPFSIQPDLMPQRHGSLLNDQDYWWVQIMARSNAGIRVPTAQNSLDMLFQSMLLATVNPEKHKAIPRLILVDGSRGLNTSARSLSKPMYVLLALVGFVLLLACVNIANLLLARSAARQREMGVRVALGAGRTRILRQLLTESLLLSFLGAFIGVALSYAGRNLLPSLISPPWEQAVFNGEFDYRVFVFATAISILAGLLFSLVPSWRTLRTQVSPELKEQTHTATSKWKGLAGKLIVSFQVALSTLLMVGAALFIHTIFNLDSVDPGFRTDHLLLFKVHLPPSLYPPPKDVNLFRSIEEKLSTLPGVGSVTLSAEPLIANAAASDDFIRLDQPPDKNNNQGAWNNAVGRDFFSTMGIPIVAGRGFNNTDTETSPKVAVINQALARQYFSEENPIGKTFRGYYFVSEVPFQIVGVSADTHFDSLRKQPPSTYYVLYHQLPRTAGEMTYELRTQVKAESLIPLLRHTVEDIDRNVPLIDVRTQTEQIHDTIRQEWLLAGLTASFGLLALALACIGIYGVMAYTVANRTHEIGIRFALGAQTQKVLKMILNEAFRLTLGGIVAGLSVALLLTRFLGTMLFGLKPNDPLALISAAILLMAVALIAAFIPALRASRVEPMQALRHE